MKARNTKWKLGMNKSFDYLIVGAGIIGAATAYKLKLKYPNCSIAIVDKGPSPASYQTGRNSGVIHAGVYYPKGSLKAQFCRAGLDQTISFCKENDLPYEQCGKIIVAADASEREAMQDVMERCQANDLSPELLTGEQINQLEPAIRVAEGFRVKQTAITDYSRITSCLLFLCEAKGNVTFIPHFEVLEVTESPGKVVVSGRQQDDPLKIEAGFMVACAGVYADKLMRKQGLQPDFRIIPFKGTYYRLPDKYNQLTSHLIYPVPDPTMPFLGVHLTKMIDGSTTIGPNATLNIGRETYSGVSLNPAEWRHSLGNKGIWKLLLKHRKYIAHEAMATLSKHYYAKRVKQYCPELNAAEFLPFRAGIRAQAMTHDGELLHDFKFEHTPLSMHVGNAPSPAATSAFPIAESIVDKL